ncbi:MAG TPA: chromate efflux transporter [Alphaproteobacteria bacterium]|nr:chromate efflux transporter [Alphaproteobacteria bacterium]
MTPAHGISLGEATKLWLKIGLLGFGGPAGQIALMHRLLVEEKRWIGEARFLHALNYCMLLPGPEAQQLATYVGWLLHRAAGGLVAGLLFVLPGALVLLGLSALYAGYHHIALVGALFYGIKAAVLAVVIEALLRIAKRALKNGWMLAIAVAAFVAIFLLKIDFPLIVLAAALIGWAGSRLAPGIFLPSPAKAVAAADVAALDRALEAGALDHVRPNAKRAAGTLALWLVIWFAPILALAAAFGWQDVFVQLGVFFSKMAVVTFGGAYAVLAYVAQEAVAGFGWLQPGEMLDGLGLAETTPGPLILVLEFVGFLAAYRHAVGIDPMLAGLIGAGVTLWATFAPCFLWIFVGAPYVEALRGNKPLAGALGAITAAVVGVIANLALWFGLHVLFRDMTGQRFLGLELQVPRLASLDIAAALLAAAALIATLRFKISMIPVLIGCALLGVAFKLWM